MKVFTDIAQNGKSQTEVTSVSTPAGKKYYNEGNLVAATQSAMGLLTASDKTKLDGIAAGANKTVVDTTLSTSSTNPVQNKIVTTALSGKAAAIHTHSYTDCVIGGGSESGSIRSLGAKLPLVFGNVFHGLPASAVVIEKSTDSGSTWTDMGISDAVKRNLVSCIDTSGIGFNVKSNVGTSYQFRVTIDAAAKGFYGSMDRIYMEVNTNGTNSCWCSVYTCEAGSTTYTLRGTYTVSGWSGWNSVPFYYIVYGSAYTGRVRYIRLVFGGDHTSTTYSGLCLHKLFGTACQKWAIPNQMNGTGVPYTVDPDLNTTFPALVKAAGFSGPLTGDVTGNATTVGDGSLKLYAHTSNEVNFGGTSTVTEIYFGHRAMDSRAIPTAYWFGDGKAKVYAGDIQLGSGKKLYFGSTGYYIELVNGNLHTNVGLYSDTFISARGKDESGSTGGATIPAMWNSLRTNTDDYGTYTIHPDHIPALDQSKINGLSGALAGKAAASHTHTKAEITDFPTSLTNPCALSVFGVSYDGSAAKTVDKTTLIGTLTAETSDVTDGTQFVTSYASDNGFSDPNAVNVPYKRKASCLYNYIKGKTDTLYVTALGTSGNYLTWKKGSTTTSITVPFATSTTVDTALSSTSTNPVQNKVVNTALGTKLNMFTSGGVASKGGSGTYSYFKFATIKITNAYSNYPIVFEMSGRGKALSLVSVTFANENSIDPALGVFTSNYDKNFWIKKSATSTWDLYGQYSETYGNYTIHRVTGAGVDSNVSVSMTNVSALPDGCTQAVYGGNVGSATKLATARTINGTSFDGSAAITTAKWGTARNISVGDGTNTGAAVSVDGSAAVTLKLPGTIKAKFVSSTSSAATSFLMGDGSVTTKKNLTSVSHCGYTSTAVDALLVPTMNTIACWNGAYNSAGSSNLAYCSKGAFGTFAAKSSLAFSELTSKPTTLSGYGITDAVNTSNQGQILTATTIDASALDADTWYPVLMGLSMRGAAYHFEITNALDSNKPSWATHSSGFTCKKIWEVYGNGWGTVPDVARRIITSLYSFASLDPVRGIGQLTNSSNEYVYVRGGGKYYFLCSRNVVPTLVTESKTISSQTIAPTTTTPAAISRTLPGGTFSGSGAVLNINSTSSNSWIYFQVNGTNKAATGYYSGLAFLANEKTYARIGVTDAGVPQYWTASSGVGSGGTLWHAGNSNLSTVDWKCKALTAASTITATGAISSSTGIYSSGYVSARGQDTSSDIALKKDFSPVGNALEYVKGTHYTRFKWKDGGGESIGIIAQEEEKREYGFLVRRHDAVGHLTYDYAASTALLGAALQEEDRKVEELKTRITELENEIKNLKLCR